MHKDHAELVEKGLVRYLYVILDCSRAMDDTDILPSRRVVSLELLKDFIDHFVAENPISHIGILASHDKRAHKVSSLSGIPQDQKDKLVNYYVNDLKIESDPYRGGEFSLKSSLDYALTSLKYTSHARRPVFNGFSSLVS